jgi:NAD(P)H-dependent FMN reductase
MNLFIPIVLGSARQGRLSEYAAKFVLEEAKKYGKFETELFDVRDFILEGKTARLGKETNADNAQKWSDSMKRADGLIVVSPE